MKFSLSARRKAGYYCGVYAVPISPAGYLSTCV